MLYVGIAVGIFILDFFIKKHVDKKYKKNIRHAKQGSKIFLEKHYNKGAVLNFGEEKPVAVKVAQTALFLAVGVWFYLSLRKNHGAISKIGLAFLLGGGASNLFDRYKQGYVIDYVGFSFGPKWLRRIIFNVSDFFIFIGSALILIGAK